MSSPDLTVIMSVFNTAPYVGEAIDSIRNQSFSNFRFFILNDGSTDQSGQIIDGYARSDDRITVFHQKNRGTVASYNYLLDRIDTPLIALMDSDDACHPERLMKQSLYLERNQEYGAVGTQTLYFDDDGKRWPMDKSYPLDAKGFLVALEDPSNPIMNHASAMIRTPLIKKIGGYRPQFKHCEDFDLWLRLAEITSIGNLAEALMYYRQHPSQVSRKFVAIQTAGAAMSWLSRRSRLKNESDPFDGLAALPALAELHEIDSITKQGGDAQFVRLKVISRILYSENDLKGDAFQVVLDYLQNGGPIANLNRLFLRLIRLGAYRSAFKLSKYILGNYKGVQA